MLSRPHSLQVDAKTKQGAKMVGKNAKKDHSGSDIMGQNVFVKKSTIELHG